MNKIYVSDVIEKCKGELLVGNKDLILENFSKDTRLINKNDVYVAIKGENFDGNSFYEEAFSKGASCCILDNIDKSIDLSKYKDKTIIKVPNTIECLQTLAEYKRNMYDIPVIAITGSVGKTSTKDIVYEVVSKKYKTLKTEKNENNHIGLPLTILKLKDHEALVVEMGMNHLKEISCLTKIAKPNIAIITNVGSAHIGNLGSRENILKAKLEITEQLKKDDTLIINNDNDLLHASYNKLKEKYNVITFGINEPSNYNATNIEDNIFSSTFETDNHKITINVGSTAFIYNALCAYSVSKVLNIDTSDTIKAISEFKLSPHRLEKKVTKNNITIIDDTYNANKDSMINALSILSKVKKQRRVAIIADILELGDYSKEIHSDIGKTITKETVDILILIGNETKYIKNEVLKNNFNKERIYTYKNYKEAINEIGSILQKNDIVLLKGSHSMNLNEIVNYLTN